MSKLIVMRGLPASGKSTIAQGRMVNDGNTIRVNKDLLRKMLHFNKFNGKNEQITRDASRELVKFFIGQGKNVIVDDTNLNPGVFQSWKDLAKELKAKFEVMDLTDVPVQECVMRDLGRDDSVGGPVIKNMALRYGLITYPKDSIVICDVDGTISDPSARLHYVTPPKKKGKKPFIKDWNSFFLEMENDTVKKETQDKLIKYYNEGKTVIFMSARPEKYREVTLRWLQSHFLTFAYTIIMRKDGDKRLDTDVKREMFEQHFPDKSVVHAILDDRPSVIRLWKELGLNVIDCGDGKEF